MWICMNDGFLSVVHKDGAPNEMCVRARRKEHLERVFPGAKIIETKGNDYRFRAFIDKNEVAKVIADRITNIDYTNFKDSVKEKDMKKLYGEVWSTMYDLQRD